MNNMAGHLFITATCPKRQDGQSLLQQHICKWTITFSTHFYNTIPLYKPCSANKEKKEVGTSIKLSRDPTFVVRPANVHVASLGPFHWTCVVHRPICFSAEVVRVASRCRWVAVDDGQGPLASKEKKWSCHNACATCHVCHVRNCLVRQLDLYDLVMLHILDKPHCLITHTLWWFTHLESKIVVTDATLTKWVNVLRFIKKIKINKCSLINS